MTTDQIANDIERIARQLISAEQKESDAPASAAQHRCTALKELVILRQRLSLDEAAFKLAEEAKEHTW